MYIRITKKDLVDSGYGDDGRAIIRLFSDIIGMSLQELNNEIEWMIKYESEK